VTDDRAAKTLVFIHGRGFKPPKAVWRRLWLEALLHGIRRDRPECLPAFEAAHKEFAYFGDLSNPFLSEALGRPVPDDAEDRELCLMRLKRYNRTEFREENYVVLPGYSPLKEAAADSLGALLGLLHVNDPLIGSVAPDVREYWNPGSAFGSRLREPLVLPLKRALNRGGEVLLVSHSLGSVIAYDTLWKFSRTGEYRIQYSDRKVDLWLTLGSPLGDETVKRHLKGSEASGARRYPSNVRRWINVAAEDDYVCHDQRIRDDFEEMTRLGLVDSVEDHRIYNLAVRQGRSNPHHSLGYLLHPGVAAAIADWVSG